MRKFQRLLFEMVRYWPFPGKKRVRRILLRRVEESTSEGAVGRIIWPDNANIILNSDLGSYIEREIYFEGSYESVVCRLMETFVQWGDVCLDVGANYGLHTIIMSREAGETGMVLAFEPMQEAFDKLQENLRLNRCRNVQVYKTALSNTVQTGTLNYDKNGLNRGIASLREMGLDGKESVDISTGDILLSQLGIDRVDLIKVDVEGYEGMVLEGLKNALNENEAVIIFEYDQNYWNQVGQTFSNTYAFLADLGYQVYKIGKQEAVAADPITKEKSFYCLAVKNQITDKKVLSKK